MLRTCVGRALETWNMINMKTCLSKFIVHMVCSHRNVMLTGLKSSIKLRNSFEIGMGDIMLIIRAVLRVCLFFAIVWFFSAHSTYLAHGLILRRIG